MPTKHSILRQVTLQIPKSKYPFFLELVKSLEFVKKIEPKDLPANNIVLENIKAGLEEIRLFKKGKLKTTPAKDFLHEL